MAGHAGFFPGDSEMARRMRAFDWTATPLGPPDTWPVNLRLAVSVCLSSPFPIHVCWGPSLTLFYNDAYIAFLGPSKHPMMLGRSGREAWSEVWTTIGPMIDRVFRTGIASWSEDMLMFFDRERSQEEVYVTFSFSPIFGDRQAVEGIFCASTETTEKIVGKRRLETLRLLSVEAAVPRRVADACAAAAKILAQNPSDVPVAALYLVSADRREATLSCAAGFPEGGWQPPSRVAIAGYGNVWPFADVLETGHPVDMTLDATSFAGVLGPWPHPQRKAVILPVRDAAQDLVTGFLVAGVSTRRPLDSGYRTFLELVAGHIATALTNARVYEDERARADALADLDRAKTEFFSNVSHELRTPLTLLLGPIQDELREKGPNARLEIVHRSARRLLKLVNTLLDTSRIEAGRGHATYEPTDLAALTTDLASVFRSAIEKAGMRLRVECAPLGTDVYVDPDMWEKIVLNLISNAFKFTLAGEIVVSLRAIDGSAVLTVSDTGAGIPASELPRVFDRFHRVLETQSRTHEGTGIGLALVKDLVNLNGGTITVESEVGWGTSFTVTMPFGTDHLPADQVARARQGQRETRAASLDEAESWLDGRASESAPTSASGPAAGPKRPSILVVDDNADLRGYVSGLLSPQYEVTSVSNGAEALAAVKQDPPDLVLADVMMPRLDGLQLVAALRANPATARLPIILLSARAGEEVEIEALAQGADDYLIKPFRARELRARIGAHLELARARKTAERALVASGEVLEREVLERRIAERQIKALLKGIVTIQEEERRRIARDIHDQLGQQMTALRMSLDAVNRRLAGDAHRVAQVEHAQQLAQDLDNSIDSLTWELRSSTLEHLGLRVALQQLVDSWSERFQTPAEFDSSGVNGLRLPHDVEANLYRLTQEALHNIVKHADAAHVTVWMELRAQELTLVIEDDGRGFEPVDATERRGRGGLGLLSMRERASLAGGTFEIDTGPDRGTALFVRVPVRPDVAGN